MVLTAEHGLLLWEGWIGVPRGWALVELEEDQTGIADLQEGWALFEATGAEWSRSYYLALLADSYRKVGRTADGLVSIAEALTHVEKEHERFHEAELYRLKGELLLNDERGMMNDERKTEQEESSQHLEAEACFHKAIDIARSQEAKSWELRAVMSLARLWQQQGKRQEAYELLSDLYSWFTEGFETADLQEAKVLLDELETQ